MGGRIDIYIDLASLYSYITIIQVLKTRDLLKQHSIEVEIHPVLLGAINAATGNKPPWTLPAKATYGAHDSRRSLSTAGLTNVSPPGDLFEAGKTQLPLRALHYVKAAYPVDVYLTTWRYLLHSFWTLHRPPNTPAVLERALSDIPVNFAPGSGDGEGEKLFAAADVSEILRAAADPKYKDALRRTTEEALGRGAFGAPWLWATDRATGEGEPFFGSDRWHHVYEFFGLPHRDVELLAPGLEKGRISKL
ncbi:thioredoxin-like protein [Hypoxylon sp. FL1150]|nr:thioredoxin-like protein [Hypoxylon sp. FL1150]